MRLIDADALSAVMDGAISDAPIYIQATVQQMIDLQPTIEPPVVQWISVEDRLPTVEPKDLSECATDNGKDFLVCFEGGYVDISTFWARGNKFGDEGVTHWMPLPEPPEEDAK